MENEARNEVQATQESTDEVILNTVLTMNGKDTSDEDDEDEEYIPVSNSEATSAIETLLLRTKTYPIPFKMLVLFVK